MAVPRLHCTEFLSSLKGGRENVLGIKCLVEPRWRTPSSWVKELVKNFPVRPRNSEPHRVLYIPVNQLGLASTSMGA